MIDRLKKINRGLFELSLGTLFLGMVCLIVGVFLVKEPILYATALSLGVLLALVTAYHMYRTLDRALDYGDGAAKAVTISNLIRYICIVAVFGMVWMIGLNPLFTFMGLMTLKFGAYMQPLTHKVVNKMFRE